jgi:hypothetical protein
MPDTSSSPSNSPDLTEKFIGLNNSEEVLLMYHGNLNREICRHLMAALKLNITVCGLFNARVRKSAFALAEEYIENIHRYYGQADLTNDPAAITVSATINRVNFVFSHSLKPNDRNLMEEEYRISGITNSEQQKTEDVGLIIGMQRAIGSFNIAFEDVNSEKQICHLKISLDTEE